MSGTNIDDDSYDGSLDGSHDDVFESFDKGRGGERIESLAAFFFSKFGGRATQTNYERNKGDDNVKYEVSFAINIRTMRLNVTNIYRGSGDKFEKISIFQIR